VLFHFNTPAYILLNRIARNNFIKQFLFLKKILFIPCQLSLFITEKKWYQLQYGQILSLGDHLGYQDEGLSNFFTAKPQYYREIYRIEILEKMEYGLKLINNAAIIGESNVVSLKNGQIIFDLYHYDYERKFAYTDTAFCDIYHNNLLLKHRGSKIKLAKGICLVTNFSFNYYHFITEVLVKLFLLNNKTINSDVPLLVDEFCGKIPQFMELLSYLNTEKRNVIFLKKGHLYHIDELHYLPLVNHIPPNYIDLGRMHYRDNWFNYGSMMYLRTMFLKNKSNKVFSNKIFLSRADASKRRNYNESEVREVVEKNGFTTVFPAQMTIAEQIALFNGAKLIVGVSGAAFTNLLFCETG